MSKSKPGWQDGSWVKVLAVQGWCSYFDIENTVVEGRNQLKTLSFALVCDLTWDTLCVWRLSWHWESFSVAFHSFLWGKQDLCSLRVRSVSISTDRSENNDKWRRSWWRVGMLLLISLTVDCTRFREHNMWDQRSALGVFLNFSSFNYLRYPSCPCLPSTD